MAVFKVMPNPLRGGLSRVVLVGDGAARVWALDYSTLFNNPVLLHPIAPGHALALRLWQLAGAAVMVAGIAASFLWAWWAFLASFAIQFLLWKGGQRSAANFAVRCGAADPRASDHFLRHGLAWIVDPPEETAESVAAFRQGGPTPTAPEPPSGRFNAQEAVAEIRAMEDLLFNPERKEELERTAPLAMELLKLEFAQGKLPPACEDMLVEAMLEAAAPSNRKAAHLLECWREGRRGPIKEGFRREWLRAA